MDAHSGMTEKEAIVLATEAMRTDPWAHLVDLHRPKARFVDGEKALSEFREKFPELRIKCSYPDHWSVTFPLWKEDFQQRESLLVTVDCLSRQAKVRPEI